MKYTDWHISEYDAAQVAEMVRQGVPALAAVVLSARGIGAEAGLRFLNEDESCFRDPGTLPDMQQAVDRVRLAIERGEYIAVYGDYDVDGITSVALMLRCLRSRGVRCTAYIPDRVDEGYGLNCEAIQQLAAQKVDLIITVDCGITAVEEVAFARSLGIDVVITDHHECKDAMPEAVAVVDPRRSDCDYPFQYFAGVGVAYKLLCALFGRYCTHEMIYAYSPLVAIGTIADVMPLVDENRAIVRIGLGCISSTPVVGVRKLCRAAGLGDSITSANVGYVLAPRINAAGRMGSAETAVRLLMTDDRAEAEHCADQLCQLNRERQQIENEIFKQAQTLFTTAFTPGGTIVLAGEHWHQGVIGIVASRMAERCAAPAFMISLDGDTGKASCRSYGGFNLFQALERAGDLLESFGGHALAAGFTIRRENIPAFRQLMDELYRAHSGDRIIEPVLDVDCEIRDLSLLELETVEGLNALEPFGSGNPSPLFSLMDMEVQAAADVGGGKHLKLILSKNGRQFDAIFFSHTAASAGIAVGDIVDVAFHPGINEYRGNSTVQLVVTDMRQNARTREDEARQLELFELYRSGAELTPEQAQALLPGREYFVAVWRYLKSHAEGGQAGGERTYLARVIARVAGIRPCVLRTLVCLDVFGELRMIDLKARDTRIHMTICDVSGKMDLNTSPIMKRLNSMAGR